MRFILEIIFGLSFVLVELFILLILVALTAGIYYIFKFIKNRW